MKQLHKQSSIPTHTSPSSSSSKSFRHQTSLRFSSASASSSSSSPSFSHRLLLLLTGAFIASTFFLLRPLDPTSTSTSTSTSSYTNFDTRNSNSNSNNNNNNNLHRLPVKQPANTRRLPAGISKPRLRVLVTGGAGFVGSHLVDRLIDRGDSVIVLDNFFTGRKQNLIHHIGNTRFELIRHDVVEPILLEVDQIYHLACPASPVHYKFNPIKTIISFTPTSLHN